VRNGLRHRIEVRVDGGFKTGRDVIMAAMLGAESYGFGTAPLVALGCAMARQCHSNTCPTGIATQREDLRAKFKGTPEQVIRYFTFVAEDVRRILAGLGFSALDDIIGRSDLLVRTERPDVPRAQMLDLSLLLAGKRESGEAGKQLTAGGTSEPAVPSPPLRRLVERNERPGVVSLDEEILGDLEPYLESALPFSGNYQIRNHHLTVGARVAGAIVERNGDAGLPPGSVQLRFSGTAGQSFGAFVCRGMHLELEGEANDYVGKGLSGGEITIRPFRRAAYAHASHQHLIVGNTVLYGATAGKLFAAGQAGDRFAVRNSGAVAVIEGAGNHCCEYMTGGIVVVLGAVGRNFAAGMSNGVAYLLDETGRVPSRINLDMVELDTVDAEDVELLKRLIRSHEEKTVSARARTILVEWERYLPLFRKVLPRGAGTLVNAIRDTYLSSTQRDLESSLERRTA
jgi:glutamate synthase (ferredoxin)